jgi:uncharacterized protein (DUF362 family)
MDGHGGTKPMDTLAKPLRKAAPLAGAGRVAVVVESAERSKRALLEEVLEEARFWEVVSAACAEAGVPADAFRIVIKPDLRGWDRDGGTATDPELVEHLVDALHHRGFSAVTVGCAADQTASWLSNREVLGLADLLGYRFITPEERPYDLIDLSEDLVPGGFPEGSSLRGASLARAWVEAHFRVSFAKSRTDKDFAYALCLANLLTVLPRRDDRGTVDRADACLSLLQRAPLHFNLIDALVSSEGSFGGDIPRPRATRTLIAGASTLLTDWVGAAKMNVDPYRSALNALAMGRVGLPEPQEIVGDLAPYPGFKNVHPSISDAVGRIRSSPLVGPLLDPAVARVNRELFPFLDPRLASLNAALSPFYARADDGAAALAVVSGSLQQLAAAGDAALALQTLLDKDGVERRVVSLDFDESAYAPADYAAVVHYLAPLEALVLGAEVDAHGLRHRYLDGSLVFEYSRVLAAPFTSFVERTPIERAITYMNDYVGGCAVPIEHDAQGRVVRQAERTIFLPQPGWMVLYGGKPIDVGKLEIVRRGEREQKIYWRTVKSSNGSADFDDGSVTFAEAPGGGTRVTIVARQRFTLPPALQAARLDLNPELKTAIELWAYRSYFDRTMNNFEAGYEGREFRVGRAPRPEGDPLAPLQEALRSPAINRGLAALTKLSAGAVQALRRIPAARATDELGYQHYLAEDAEAARLPAKSRGRVARTVVSSLFSAARAFTAELAESVAKDIGSAGRDA